MLPLLQEYRIEHIRFKEHLTIALLMAMVAPVCAIILFRTIGWWNPWLWASCGVGMALALCIISAVALHHYPRRISGVGRILVQRSSEWFPYYFVVVQSSIAALIVMFMWFSISALVLEVPLYVHITLVLLALLIPARRFVRAKISYTAPPVYEWISEILHGLWHTLLSIFVARSVISMTISDIRDTSPENVSWQIIVWIPAVLYILLTLIMTTKHIIQGRASKPGTKPRQNGAADAPSEFIDRF